MSLIQGKQIRSGSIGDDRLTEQYINSDGTRAMAADLDTGNNKITNLADPTAPQDAVNLQTAEALIQGLKHKDPVLYGTTGNITDFNTQATVEGALDTVSSSAPTLQTDDRVLVKNQVLTEQNGIYVWSGSALVRASDADAAGELSGGSYLGINAGDTLADSRWYITSPDGDVDPGITPHTWSAFTSGVGNPRDGLVQNGNFIDLDPEAGGGLEIAGGPGTGGQARIARADLIGNGLEAGAGNVDINVLAEDDTVAVGASGVRASTPTDQDKQMTPSVTAGDEQPTGLTITSTPAGNSFVSVFVNGALIKLGDGQKLTADAYFSANAGVTPKAFNAIAAGDELFWNATNAGYNLDANDEVDFNYALL